MALLVDFCMFFAELTFVIRHLKTNMRLTKHCEIKVTRIKFKLNIRAENSSES